MKDNTIIENFQEKYYDEQCIPRIEYYFSNFPKFIDEREKLLKQRIKDAFPDSFDKVVDRYGLTNKI